MAGIENIHYADFNKNSAFAGDKGAALNAEFMQTLRPFTLKGPMSGYMGNGPTASPLKPAPVSTPDVKPFAPKYDVQPLPITPELLADFRYRLSNGGVPTTELNKYGGYDALFGTPMGGGSARPAQPQQPQMPMQPQMPWFYQGYNFGMPQAPSAQPRSPFFGSGMNPFGAPSSFGQAPQYGGNTTPTMPNATTPPASSSPSASGGFGFGVAPGQRPIGGVNPATRSTFGE